MHRWSTRSLQLVYECSLPHGGEGGVRPLSIWSSGPRGPVLAPRRSEPSTRVDGLLQRGPSEPPLGIHQHPGTSWIRHEWSRERSNWALQCRMSPSTIAADMWIVASSIAAPFLVPLPAWLGLASVGAILGRGGDCTCLSCSRC